MKKNTLTIASAIALSIMSAAPVFALDVGLGAKATAGAQVGSTTVRAGAEAKMEARITNAKNHANEEIDRRSTALTNLNTKVQAMVRLSSEEKASIETFVQDQITALAALKAKIAADVDIATLKTDIKSITQSYRIFLLIMPQAHITVAADKILTAVQKLSALDGKLAQRIADAKSKGTDVSAQEAAEADIKAKLTEASAQATAASAAVVALTPDNGDQAKAAANKQALQDARNKIKAALQALADARKDAGAIVAGLKGEAALGASASTTVQQ